MHQLWTQEKWKMGLQSQFLSLTGLVSLSRSLCFSDFLPKNQGIWNRRKALRSSGYKAFGNASQPVLGKTQVLDKLHSTSPSPVSSTKQLFRNDSAVSEASTLNGSLNRAYEGAGTARRTAEPTPPYVTLLGLHVNSSQKEDESSNSQQVSRGPFQNVST